MTAPRTGGKRLHDGVVPRLAHRKHAVCEARGEILPRALDDHAGAGALAERSERRFGRVDAGEHAPRMLAKRRQLASGQGCLEERLPDRAAARRHEHFARAGIGLVEAAVHHVAGVVAGGR
jgi:hypothetical protein